VPEAKLLDKKPVTLHVVEISDLQTPGIVPILYATEEGDSQAKRGKFCSDVILDIDLDFFSTANPFRAMYSAKQYDLINKLYKYTPPNSSEDIEEHTSRRASQLAELAHVFNQLCNGTEKVSLPSSAKLVQSLSNV
jgi:hypothetical protein